MEELVYLSGNIKARRLQEIKVQLMIVQNPHVKNPKELWDILEKSEGKKRKSEQFDNVGFDRLKGVLDNRSRLTVK